MVYKLDPKACPYSDYNSNPAQFARGINTNQVNKPQTSGNHN